MCLRKCHNDAEDLGSQSVARSLCRSAGTARRRFKAEPAMRLRCISWLLYSSSSSLLMRSWMPFLTMPLTKMLWSFLFSVNKKHCSCGFLLLHVRQMRLAKCKAVSVVDIQVLFQYWSHSLWISTLALDSPLGLDFSSLFVQFFSDFLLVWVEQPQKSAFLIQKDQTGMFVAFLVRIIFGLFWIIL